MEYATHTIIIDEMGLEGKPIELYASYFSVFIFCRRTVVKILVKWLSI